MMILPSNRRPLFLLLFLTSCHSYEDAFDCPSYPGVGCQSISEVNQRLDQGSLKGGSPPTFATFPESGAEKRLISVNTKSLKALAGPVWRVPEQTMEVWIKGYVDTNGYYHHDAKVHMVVRPATWQLQP